MRVNSLTTRFLLALLLCTAVPFLLFGLYVRGEVRDREEQQVVSVYLARWADDAARKIATSIENAYRVGWTLAMDAEAYIRSKGGLNALEENVLSLYQVIPDFLMVILADSSGKVLQVTRNPGLDAERGGELELLEPASVKEYEWFRMVSQKAPEYWVPRHLSPFMHRSPDKQSLDPADYCFGLSIAVQDSNGAHGALFILLRWQQIQAVVDDTQMFLRDNAGFESARAFLCDPDGRVLAHSDRAQYGRQLPPSSRAAVLDNDFGHAVFEEAGVEQGLGFATVRSGLHGFDWRVGLYAPIRELFDVSREFGRWLLWVIPIIAGLLALLAALSSRAIVGPVRRLAEATREIAQGHLEARVDPRGGDELADLGRAFNKMAQDLSESREQLRDAERQAAWAEMARQVAHEIKNPLTPMRMGAQMMLRARSAQDERWEELAERLARNVLTQTDALDRIASDFRQFAGGPEREVREVPADDLLAGVGDLIASMTEAGDVELRIEPGAPGARVAVDLSEMRRVFLNLAHNAVHACEGSGSALHLYSKAGSDRVEFRIEDDGVGVPDDMRSRLFEPYFTTKTSGTGLGLAICRRIVEAHQGDIKLESSVPGRTVFLLTLPRVS